MKFKTKQKLYEVKCKLSKALSNIWYTSVYPLAWILDKHSEFKYKHFQKKVDNLTIQEAGELMAKHILKKMVDKPTYAFEFYVCNSLWYPDAEPDTMIDYMLYDLYYAKRKYKVLYQWAYKKHYYKNMNDVWLNEALCQIVFDELCDIEGLDVHWEYETDLTDPWKTWQPIKDYQKHLVIKVKK